MATVQPLVLGGPMASSILVPPSQQLSSPPAFNADVSAVPGPAAGAAGSQPMTDLLGVVDPAQPTAAPPAPAPGPEVIVPVNEPNDPAASPVQATSAVGGAPRVVMTSAMNGAPAVPAPTPAPAVSEQMPKPEQQASQDWSGRPLASDSSGGGDGGVHPEEQVQPRPQPQPSPQPAQAGGPNEGQAQTGKPADQPSPANQPDDNPALSQPHLANPPVDTGADLDLGLAPSQSPAPVPVPVPAPSKRPDGAADKAAQDDFAKHWQSDSGGDSGTAKGEGSEDELKSGPGDKPETSTTRGENGKAQVTGVIVTTWTADGKVHTGTETPRGAGGGATSTGAGGASRTTVSAVTTGEAGKPSPAAATGGKNDDDEQGDALTNEEARNDEASATIAPPTPGDHPAPTSFSINPSSSYTVVTGTVTLTGQAAVSAIKAGATPLDASGGTSTKDKETGGGPGTFVIAGIVSGVVVVVLLGCWVWYRIRKKKAQNGPDSEKTDTYPDSNPNTPGPDGRRGNETDWTDSGFDFIDDPISATSTQIRHRRSTIAAYYDRNGVRQHGREHDPFDDLNAREYAEAYRGDQGRMETMYEEKEYGYGYDGGHSQQQHHVQGGYHAGNAPGAGQVWRTENPFAEPQHVHQSGYGYDSQPYDDRRTSPLQGLPTSPPDNFASAQARSRGPTPPLSSTHRSSRYPCQAPALASGKSAFDSHLHPATTNEQLGYQSRAGTQYGETATGLYGAYNRDDNAYTTADYEQEHDGRTGPYAMPLETGLPAKTPATGSLLPWLDADEARGLPPVPAGGVAGPAGPGSGRKGKKEKSKNGKGKDKKKSRGRAGEEAYENEQPMINGSERRLHPTQQAPVTNYDLVDPNQQEPFTDDQEDMPHPVRAAMAATPAVAKMQMRQRNMDEVPIPNFR